MQVVGRGGSPSGLLLMRWMGRISEHCLQRWACSWVRKHLAL